MEYWKTQPAEDWYNWLGSMIEDSILPRGYVAPLSCDDEAWENRCRVSDLQRAEIRPDVELAIARASLVDALGEYFAAIACPGAAAIPERRRTDTQDYAAWLGSSEPDPVCEAYRLILGATEQARVELLSRGMPAVRAERWARRQKRRKLRSMVYRIS